MQPPGEGRRRMKGKAKYIPNETEQSTRIIEANNMSLGVGVVRSKFHAKTPVRLHSVIVGRIPRIGASANIASMKSSQKATNRRMTPGNVGPSSEGEAYMSEI